MSKKYNIETFLDETVCTKDDVIDQKIILLYDRNILSYGPHYTMNDEREPLVREVLKTCESETAMTITLHDVVFFTETLEDWLERKGVM